MEGRPNTQRANSTEISSYHFELVEADFKLHIVQSSGLDIIIRNYSVQSKINLYGG